MDFIDSFFAIAIGAGFVLFIYKALREIKAIK